jgi:mRNA-degrading endonuclease RelE of RelBE toxin-antitoxin system
MSAAYEIRHAREASADIRALRAFDQRKILAAIEMYLARQPEQVSKSRIKAMTQPFWSQYRLRVEDFRVYYDVDNDSRCVNVLRVRGKTTQHTPEEIL